MSSKRLRRRLLLAARPWMRNNPRPPKARTLVGETFSAANYAGALVLQHCQACEAVQYPPRERCHECLDDALVWRATDTKARLLATTEIHVSQWEFFKRKVKVAPWPIGTVSLAGQCLFVHIAAHTFISDGQAPRSVLELKKGERVSVFSHSDLSSKSVLIGVSHDTPIALASDRTAIVKKMGLI